MPNNSRPKTLLDFAGAVVKPLPLASSAIVIIDAQEEYRSGQLPLVDLEEALAKVADVLDGAREAGIPIVHIQQIGRSGGLFDPDGPTGNIMDEVKPQADEIIIRKPLPNAFAKTKLDETLKSLAPEQVIFTGFMTHMCVSATTRAALDLGYRSVVVSDAVATRDLPDPVDPSVTIRASQVHRATLAALGDRFASITPSNAFL